MLSFGQVTLNRDIQFVLRHDNVGKKYVFDRSKSTDYNKTEITFLGKLKALDGRIFKILNSKWYWGTSPRATSRISIFNNKNQYLGNYYLTMTSDLPDKIETNALVFTNYDNKNCDAKLITRISFKNGLPRHFFLKCKENYGDMYSFGVE